MSSRILYLLSGLGILLTGTTQASTIASLKRHTLPSYFLENRGQVTDQYLKPRQDVRYILREGNFQLTLKDNSFSYELFAPQTGTQTTSGKLSRPNSLYNVQRVDISLPGANENPDIIPEEPSGTDWLFPNGISTKGFGKITYRDIYPNIDIVFLADPNGKLEYTINVRPGGDLSKVRLTYSGLTPALKDNALQLAVNGGLITENIPKAYIEESGAIIQTQFVVQNNTVSFTTGAYDRSSTLIIDPDVEWATYFGGSDIDKGMGVAVDTFQNAFLAGYTSSTGLATTGAYQTTVSGTDAFLAKFDSAGNLAWATYFGGSGTEEGLSVATDKTGNVYLAGYTNSSSSIATTGAYQTSYGTNDDAFLAKFNYKGSLKWATYYGGSLGDYGYAVATDKLGNVFLGGYTQSSSGIASGSAYQTTYGGSEDAFIAKFDSTGTRQWATYYGGSDVDHGFGLATDYSGDVYMTGYTQSTSGIASASAYQTTYGTRGDAFLVKFSSSGSRLWGTYYGSDQEDDGYGVATDYSGNVYMGGYSFSSTTSLASTGAYQTSNNGNFDAILVKFNSSGSRQWATYYGGTSADYGYSVAVDPSNDVYLAGATNSSTDIATNDAYQNTNYGNQDGFMAKFSSSGTRQYATYYGDVSEDGAYGVATKDSQTAYLAGYTASSSGIATPNGYQQTYGGGGYDAFLVKFEAMGTPLPVELVSFEATLRDQDVLLYWQTASETNNRGFEMERSTDGHRWEAIDFIPSRSRNGNSQSLLSYDANDEHLPAAKKIYYRFRQVDYNGRENYSPIRVISFQPNTLISIYPNPAENSLHLLMPEGYKAVSADVLRPDGRSLQTYLFSTENRTPDIDISTLPAGIYVLRLNCGNDVSVCRFVKY
jgi:hypothetical protein